MKKKISAVLIAIAIAVVAAVVLYDAFSDKKQSEASGIAMGSVVSVKVYGRNSDGAGEKIISAAEKIENENISRYKSSSEISRLNSEKNAELSDYTADVLNRSSEISKASNGAFDITLGKVSSLWNFDSDSQTVPDEKILADAVSGVGFEKIQSSGNNFSIGENQELDLGAVGKGLACDSAKLILDSSGIDGAVVAVGGSVLVYGKNPEGKYWTVGVRTPEKEDNSVALKIKIDGTKFVSTSGNYEKCFTKDGVLYHHILSPKSGFPADEGLKSVTVLSDSGLSSDALSTACFVLGMEKSKELLKKYNADAVFIDSENNCFVSENIFGLCSAESDAYTLYKY